MFILCILAAMPSSILLELSPIRSDGSTSVEEKVIFWQGQQYSARVVPETSYREHRQLEEPEVLSPSDFWFDLTICIGLVCFAGIAAGCTMGILSLDHLTLNLKMLEGTPSERQWAASVLPVVQRHHHLLVALLLCNACANEALPIFVSRRIPIRSSARPVQLSMRLPASTARPFSR